MNVKNQIELGNQQPALDEGAVHRLFLREVQDQIDKLVLETAAVSDNYIIYGISDNTGIRYIGITSHNIAKRLREHIARAKHYSKKCHRDWWILKCLRDNISLNIFVIYKFNIDRSTAEKIERLIINTCINKGKNLTNATCQNFTPSVALKDKNSFNKAVVILDLQGKYVREFKSIKDCAIYFNCNDSHITNVLKGKKNSVRNHLCVYKTDYDPSFEYVYKQYMYDKSPMKNDLVKLKQKVRVRQLSCKPILRISSDGSAKPYECIIDAVKELGLPKNYTSNILKCCNGKRNFAYGYKWKYLK